MAAEKPFLLPVVVDDTQDSDAHVPDKFREVQWTRLAAGETSPAFVQRVSRLLSPEPVRAPAEVRSQGAAVPHAAGTARQSAPSPAASRPAQRVLLVIAAVVVIGIGYFAVDKFILSKRPVAGVQSPAPSGQPAAPAGGAIPEKSIAVLPFVDMSEKKDQEYFSDGLADELLDLLAQVPDLRVPARTSSFAFKGKSEDIPSIAQKLRVAHVLEGSVRKAGNMIRVTVQLIRADSGYHIWSKTYDRDFKDIFKVQDEIAAAVVEALKIKLGPTQPIGAHRSSNPEAYNEYLLGRQFHRHGNNDGWRRAIEAFHQAIALDPHYAAAYAGLAMSEAFLADQTGEAAGLRQADADAERAVELAPEEADGYASRGYLRSTYSWDWAGAQADFTKALLLDPASATVQRSYALLLKSQGRLSEAIAAEKKAIELDPLSSATWNNLGRSLTSERDYPAAGEALRRALEIQPESTYSLYSLARLQLLEGHAAQALARSRKISDDEAFRLQGIAMAEHTLAHVKESQQALDELIAKYAQDSAYQIAEALAWRGEKEKAFEWLERAYQQRDGGLVDVKVDPVLDGLQGDPRFKAFLKKMKLPQ
jgi:TolB-like protein/Tfp pilus assembly protein PilF